MQRSTYILFVFCTLSWVGGCSDLGSTVCDKGEVSVDGACMKPDIDDRFADPPSRTKTLTLACTNDQTPDPSAAGWELTVDPGPIVGGEAFGAVFGGTLVVDESLLDESLALVPSGYTRVRIHDLRATVHVRSGIASANADVALRNQPIQTTCAYDKRGRDGPLADPQFPPCSTAKDDENGSGSNADCTGLGGVPDPRNPCGQFVSLPFSTDCELCANEGKAAQCADLGFCITDNLKIVLREEVGGYFANGSGNVLFGWDDQSTGAILDGTGPDARWILSPAVFDRPVGSNGFRITIGNEVDVAFECTMASGSNRFQPMRDAELISFDIQTQ
jgi:hypothetical protein